ncbi:hypothetical protein VaNZ11_009338 [Volvox africanus]|uniref:Ankyrin repeat protein n=1 Tax=Volvox africanus TaxID=51714 RepID=A0ABQ5S735_9CHLO|nr:hypothetical protein VaNZ11_009338 [Volvox africanus]
MDMNMLRGGPRHPLEVPYIIRHVARFLEHNEIACTLMHLNKATRTALSGQGVIITRQPVPRHAFIKAWGSTQSMKRLSPRKKRKLLVLTAESGDVDNLKIAIESSGEELHKAIFNGAAVGGSVQVSKWLLHQRCPFGTSTVKLAAEKGNLEVVLLLFDACSKDDLDNYIRAAWTGASIAGQWGVCEGLQRQKAFECHHRIARDALYGGDVDRTARLMLFLQTKACPIDAMASLMLVLGAIAYKCELQTLQRLYTFQQRYTMEGDIRFRGAILLTHAIASATSDWRLKVQWLEDQGAQFTDTMFLASVKCCNGFAFWESLFSRWDWSARLQVLLQRGMENVFGVWLRANITDVNTPALLQLLAEAGFRNAVTPFLREEDITYAVITDNAAFLTQLVALGCPIGPGAIEGAVNSGHLDMLQLLAGALAGAERAAAVEAMLRTRSDLLRTALTRNNLDVAGWLRERGCPWPQDVVLLAVSTSQPVELLGWLVTSGCPLEDANKASLAAVKASNVAALLCLQRLCVPVSWYVQRRTRAALRMWVRTAVDTADVAALERLVAACNGQTMLAPFLREEDITYAVITDNAAFLTQLVALGCPIGPGAIEGAVNSGHLDMLQLLAGHPAVADRNLALLSTRPSLILTAIARGDLDMARWLRERGCPWPQNAVSLAASVNNFDLLVWLLKSGCPLEDPDKAFLVAGEVSDLGALRALQLLGGYLSRSGAERMRTTCGTETVLRWLRNEWYPADDVMEEARTQAELRPVLPQPPQQDTLWTRLTSNIAHFLGRKRQREEVEEGEGVTGDEEGGRRRVKRRAVRFGCNPQ